MALLFRNGKPILRYAFNWKTDHIHHGFRLKHSRVLGRLMYDCSRDVNTAWKDLYLRMNPTVHNAARKYCDEKKVSIDVTVPPLTRSKSPRKTDTPTISLMAELINETTGEEKKVGIENKEEDIDERRRFAAKMEELEELLNVEYEVPDLVLAARRGRKEENSENDSVAETQTSRGEVSSIKLPPALEMYGGPDPSTPLSDVPCSGCGALLHCRDEGIPGYMPSLEFKAIPRSRLREYVCRRCRLMRDYNLALDASVDPEEYRRILKWKLSNEEALVVVVVDLLDPRGSLLEVLPRLVGGKRPLYVVGNKVDLLPADGEGYLRRIKKTLADECERAGLVSMNRIQHLGLISAKTGYGIEVLVTKLMRDWSTEGDVYVLGCTNVGKSTLFNALISSDYCDSTARDFINRATVSLWPGTTLSFLKFPIINLQPWKLMKRADRLLRERSDKAEEKRLSQSRLSNRRHPKYPTLIGHVGRTFIGPKEELAKSGEFMPHTLASYKGSGESIGEGTSPSHAELSNRLEQRVGKKYNDYRYRTAQWCYDTPGVVNKEQIINLLTQEELSVVLPSRQIAPRTFILKPGQVLFVSGLGRVDYMSGKVSIYFTVVASNTIPIHVVNGDEAEQFYRHHIGQPHLGVPLGDMERLQRLPPLLQSQNFRLTGLGWNESSADILLSSLGWVAVAAGMSHDITVSARTPGGLGCSLRRPSMLPFLVSLRGRRVYDTDGKRPIGTPAYRGEGGSVEEDKVEDNRRSA